MSDSESVFAEMQRRAEALGFTCSSSAGVLHCEIRNNGQRKGVGIAGDANAIGELYMNAWDNDLVSAMRSVGLNPPVAA